jgi:hypothetical protein
MELAGWEGYVLSGNEYRNVYSPYYPVNFDTLSERGHIESELLVCDPVGTGYDAGNRGIGIVPSAGPAFRFMIEDCDPSSPTWGNLKNTCRLQSGALPSSGTWVRGQIVWKQSLIVASGKVLLGWARITTGSGNVLGVDWEEIYATTS